MLDIYWSLKPVEGDTPPTSQMILRLSLEEHRQLSELWKMASRKSAEIKYFEDGILEPEKARNLFELVDQLVRQGDSPQIQSLLLRFHSALSKAVERDAMLLCYCD